MANPTYNLTKYEDQWVALSNTDGEVVAVGKDAREAQAQAEENGYKDSLILKVPSSDYGYIPLA
jgi:hypothetical protein